MFADEDIVLFLHKYGAWVLVGSFVLLIYLIFLNIRLWRRSRREASEGEATIDWSQNMDEVEIDFPLPPDVTSRDVECRITCESIRFAFRGEKAAHLEGTLYRRVLPDDCNWQLWPIGKPTHVKLSLIKAKSGHWKDVLIGENDKKSS